MKLITRESERSILTTMKSDDRTLSFIGESR